MYPWLRLFRVGLGLVGKKKVDLMTTTSVRMRVWPHDLDFNCHVNNGRYLSLADIGRVHWCARTGLLGMAVRQRAVPVVGDVIAKFRRELKVFQSFEVHTRLVGWNSKWGFLEHRFVRDGRVIGSVTIRGVFKGASGLVKPEAMLHALGHKSASPALQEWVNQFHSSSELASAALRAEEQWPEWLAPDRQTESGRLLTLDEEATPAVSVSQ